MRKGGAFCETYGKSIRNTVLEYLLENQALDFAVGDMAREVKISRPKAYEIIGELEKKGFVAKSRIIGKTQLYLLNKTNPRAKLLMKSFKECLRLVAEEHLDNHAHSAVQSSRAGLAYAKSI
ncbi:hypothetical protein JXB28_02390 [Candidatus Woesearchaeota archaeon]|nr:hypothetical protein [Candidatus Woesearchaeota archaeon]